MMARVCCFVLLFVAVASSFATPQPTLDDLWEGNAVWKPTANFSHSSLPKFGVGTQVFPLDSTWYLFNRHFSAPTSICTGGVYSLWVRASNDKGLSWGPPHPVAIPDQSNRVCQYVDGSPFYDEDTNTWHYLSQQADAGGGWDMAHFSLRNSRSPLGGQWEVDKFNPVVKGGQLWSQICKGPNKHCTPGTIDEGTPQIIEKRKSDKMFVVTFHGYDYGANRAARGVALTPDFHEWIVEGSGLPDDAIFSRTDCQTWDVDWASTGCIGSGAASVLYESKSRYYYMMIEAADVSLGCDLQAGVQWWPFGLVRSQGWTPSPTWQSVPLPNNPFLQGPHVGCTLQYNAFWRETGNNATSSADVATYWAYWSLNIQADALRCETWYIHRLEWGKTPRLPLHPPIPKC